MSGLITVAFADYVGRLPILFYFQTIALAACVWAAAATSLKSFLAARIIHGLFSSAAQGGALLWIKDLYFYHEHPRKINWVELPIILSPYVGEVVTGLVTYYVSWQWAFWIITILTGVGWLLIVFFVDETLFDRTNSNMTASVTAAQSPRWKKLLGISQIKYSRFHRSFSQIAMQIPLAMTKIPVLLVVVFYFLNFAWVIGVNTTLGLWLTNFYGFNTKDFGNQNSAAFRTPLLTTIQACSTFSASSAF